MPHFLLDSKNWVNPAFGFLLRDGLENADLFCESGTRRGLDRGLLIRLLRTMDSGDCCRFGDEEPDPRDWDGRPEGDLGTDLRDAPDGGLVRAALLRLCDGVFVAGRGREVLLWPLGLLFGETGAGREIREGDVRDGTRLDGTVDAGTEDGAVRAFFCRFFRSSISRMTIARTSSASTIRLTTTMRTKFLLSSLSSAAFAAAADPTTGFSSCVPFPVPLPAVAPDSGDVSFAGSVSPPVGVSDATGDGDEFASSSDGNDGTDGSPCDPVAADGAPLAD